MMTEQEKLASRREARRKWKKANPEKNRESVRRYVQIHPERVHEAHQKWKKNNPERQRVATQRWKEANPERVREGNRVRLQKWREANPERYQEMNQKSDQKWKGENPEKILASGRKSYLKKRVALAGRECPAVCEVCGAPPGKRALHFDHDHETGKFRGWLCHGCNLALGFADDDSGRLRALADYLEKFANNRPENLQICK